MPTLEPHAEFDGLLLDALPQTNATNSSIRTQVIVAEYQDQRIAFKSAWIEEVLLFQREKLYSLPFYPPQLVGLYPRQGQLIPLVKYGEAESPNMRMNLQETLHALRLSAAMDALSGVAILVDKIVGTMDLAKFEIQNEIQLFAPQNISTEIFQPGRWR